MRRLTTALVISMLIGAACSSDAGTASSTAATVSSSTGSSPVTSTSTTTTSTTPATASTPSTTTSTAATTTTEPSTTTTVPVITNPLPTLADGRPATFVAVTTDYRAVEVDTETGEILAFLGQTGTPEEFDEMELGPNVIVGAWRNAEGTVFALSDCCEPAGGHIMYLAPGETLSVDRSDHVATDGWTVAPAPVGTEFARLGYLIGVYEALPAPVDRVQVWADESLNSFPQGRVAWSRDLDSIYWVAGESGVLTLNTLDLTDASPEVQIGPALDFADSRHWLDGVDMQASGNLVAFLHTIEDGTTVDTDGLVFGITGELIASFPVEVGSTFGGYDPTGKYLIYVDRDGVVRWQGRGQSGVLGEGFIHASW